MKTNTPISTLTSKLGTAREVERSRIWIEGKRLTAAGFARGDKFTALWDAKHAQLLITSGTAPNCADGLYFKTTYGTVAGTAERPIIDITGQRVRDLFSGHVTHVDIEFYEGVIAVKSARGQ